MSLERVSIGMNILEQLPKPFLVLAPMDDVTDTVFRQIVASTAAPDLFFTEFVNVDGLQSIGREKLLPKIRFSKIERPLIAQLWGKNPDNYYRTAKELVELGFDGIDINMGCPDKTVVKNGCCVALINNRELAGEIIQATQEGAGTSLPVSVKTRLGFNTVDLSWHEHLLKYKLNMLSIHARTALQLSKVPPNWQYVEQIRQLRDALSPSTLIVGNGDIAKRTEGEQLATEHGLDGVMIGRGIFADPFVFAVRSPWPAWDRQQRIELYRCHVELFAKTWRHGERKVHTLNKFCKIYIQGFAGAKELRERLMCAETIDDLLEILKTAASIKLPVESFLS